MTKSRETTGGRDRGTCRPVRLSSETIDSAPSYGPRETVTKDTKNFLEVL